MVGRRAAGCEYAERVNAAAELVDRGTPLAEVARVLADRFAVSPRQARRYAEQAAGAGRQPVPETSVVFTVKLPASLADRVRDRARETGVTISALVTAALLEFLSRGRRQRRRR
jgi:hypothetical protein